MRALILLCPIIEIWALLTQIRREERRRRQQMAQQ